MSNYRAYLIDADDKIVRVEILPCPDDQTAIAEAKQLVDGHDVELWHRSRKIARLGPHATVASSKKGIQYPASRPRESQLEMSERHVQEGEELVERQERLVEQAERDGQNVLVANETLRILRATLQRHRERLNVLRGERGKGNGS